MPSNTVATVYKDTANRNQCIYDTYVYPRYVCTYVCTYSAHAVCLLNMGGTEHAYETSLCYAQQRNIHR